MPPVGEHLHAPLHVLIDLKGIPGIVYSDTNRVPKAIPLASIHHEGETFGVVDFDGAGRIPECGRKRPVAMTRCLVIHPRQGRHLLGRDKLESPDIVVRTIDDEQYRVPVEHVHCH